MTRSNRLISRIARDSVLAARRSAVIALLATSACSGDTSRPSTPVDPFAPTPPAGVPVVKWDTTPMTIKGKAFTMEVAERDEQIERGLMYRDAMKDDHGMLFCMGTPKVSNFWMRNTRIRLDIIFLDATGKVLQIDHRMPFDETGMGPATPILYVVELNVGMAEKIGLKLGDIVEIPKKYAKPAPTATAPATRPTVANAWINNGQ